MNDMTDSIDIIDAPNIKEYNSIHSNTAINFYPSKINNTNDIYNNSNSNSNQNKYYNSNNIYNNEESKINNIIIKEINDLKLDNLKRHNSPYKISKETNYYIKRKMKLNNEKISSKKKDGNIQNELYMSYNNQNNTKNNYLNNNNYIYNNMREKYFLNENENYFYANNNY